MIFKIKHFHRFQVLLKTSILSIKIIMNNIFRGLIAGYGATKLGGGCLGTIVIFALIWFALGQCN